MSLKIVYSPDSLEDLKLIKKRLTWQFGKEKCRENIDIVKNGIKKLAEYPKAGVSTKDKWDIDSKYYVIYVHHNYVFYFVDDEYIKIVNIIDEREDVIWRMFRIGLNDRPDKMS